MSNISATLNLFSGSKVDIIMPRGHNYSRAIRKYNNQQEFDASLFLMEELCLVDGEKKPFDYYKEMYCDDYMKLVELLGNIVTVIR